MIKINNICVSPGTIFKTLDLMHSTPVFHRFQKRAKAVSRSARCRRKLNERDPAKYAAYLETQKAPKIIAKMLKRNGASTMTFATQNCLRIDNILVGLHLCLA